MSQEEVVLALLTRIEKKQDFATKAGILQSVVIALLVAWLFNVEARLPHARQEGVTIEQSITSQSNQDKLNKNYVHTTKRNYDNEKRINGVEIEGVGNGNSLKK